MTITGYYCLEIYCDFPACEEISENPNINHPAEEMICRDSRRECILSARSDGWVLNLKNNTSLCPKHAKIKYKYKKDVAQW